MEIKPIVSAMLRSKVGVVLVGLQIAITLAVVANALFMIDQRLDKVARPTGVDTPNLLFVQSYGFAPAYDARSTINEDLALLRGIPGVVAASVSASIPQSGGGQSSTYGAAPPNGSSEQPRFPLNLFMLDEAGLDAYGMKLVAGRWFTAEEILRVGPSDPEEPRLAVLTRLGAEQYFGDADPVGKQFYGPLGDGVTVIGVVDQMLGSWVHSEFAGKVAFMPVIRENEFVRYAVRSEPGQRDAVMAEVERRMMAANPTRIINFVRTHEWFLADVYRGDRQMVQFLWTIVGLLLVVTALGVVGLASFQVNVRRRQIGTRRALGARRIDIVRYFMVENGLMTAGGIVVGSLLAIVAARWLSDQFELPLLGLGWIAATAAGLAVLGQLAVFVPARRAAAIPPAIATRNV